jgi:hypothetical protein
VTAKDFGVGVLIALIGVGSQKIAIREFGPGLGTREATELKKHFGKRFMGHKNRASIWKIHAGRRAERTDIVQKKRRKHKKAGGAREAGE